METKKLKVYLCSIGQKTTNICKEQLENFGLEVIMLDDKESWIDKYMRFIMTAQGNCFRIDADIILNDNFKHGIYFAMLESILKKEMLMVQYCGYDFYRNDIGVIGITFYAKEAFDIIRSNVDRIDCRRPEATAWRIPEINKRTTTFDLCVGTHGFFQTEADLERHKSNKIDRKQIDDYDFDLASKLLKL